MATPAAVATEHSIRLPFRACQQKLLTGWLLGAAPSVVLMTAFTTVGPWQSDAEEMWKWFEPAILPTVLLLIGSYIATENAPDAEARTADRHLFRTTFGLSIAYLALLATTLLVGYKSDVAMTTFRRFELPLRFLNVITSACIGYFLVATQKR